MSSELPLKVLWGSGWGPAQRPTEGVEDASLALQSQATDAQSQRAYPPAQLQLASPFRVPGMSSCLPLPQACRGSRHWPFPRVVVKMERDELGTRASCL